MIEAKNIEHGKLILNALHKAEFQKLTGNDALKLIRAMEWLADEISNSVKPKEEIKQPEPVKEIEQSKKVKHGRNK